LKATPAGFVWAGKDYPAARISLRSSTRDAVTVVDEETGSLLGLVELERAYSTVHDGAVYLHLGEPYLVRLLDLEARAALVSPFRGDWDTMTKEETDTAILEERRREHRCGLALGFGSVAVTEQVVAYQRRRISTQEVIDLVPLDMPETTFETEAVWYLPTNEQLEGFESLPKLLGALHAAEHSMIALLPLWAMCDRWDIGGLSTNLHRQTRRPTVFVYDGHAGGVGIALRGHDRFAELVTSAARVVDDCSCRDGCPSCVQSPKSGNLNEML